MTFKAYLKGNDGKNKLVFWNVKRERFLNPTGSKYVLLNVLTASVVMPTST
jgi:hypothetical protein